jgi:hypothetical protein
MIVVAAAMTLGLVEFVWAIDLKESSLDVSAVAGPALGNKANGVAKQAFLEFGGSLITNTHTPAFI